MSTIRWAAALVSAGLLAGCATAPKDKETSTPPPPPPSSGSGVSLEQARMDFKRANPQAMVGVVSRGSSEQQHGGRE